MSKAAAGPAAETKSWEKKTDEKGDYYTFGDNPWQLRMMDIEGRSEYGYRHPKGWTQILDAKDQLYYWNEITNESTWELPGAREGVPISLPDIELKEAISTVRAMETKAAISSTPIAPLKPPTAAIAAAAEVPPQPVSMTPAAATPAASTAMPTAIPVAAAVSEATPLATSPTTPAAATLAAAPAAKPIPPFLGPPTEPIAPVKMFSSSSKRGKETDQIGIECANPEDRDRLLYAIRGLNISAATNGRNNNIYITKPEKGRGGAYFKDGNFIIDTKEKQGEEKSKRFAEILGLSIGLTGTGDTTHGQTESGDTSIIVLDKKSFPLKNDKTTHVILTPDAALLPPPSPAAVALTAERAKLAALEQELATLKTAALAKGDALERLRSGEYKAARGEVEAAQREVKKAEFLQNDNGKKAPIKPLAEAQREQNEAHKALAKATKPELTAAQRRNDEARAELERSELAEEVKKSPPTQSADEAKAVFADKRKLLQAAHAKLKGAEREYDEANRAVGAKSAKIDGMKQSIARLRAPKGLASAGQPPRQPAQMSFPPVQVMLFPYVPVILIQVPVLYITPEEASKNIRKYCGHISKSMDEFVAAEKSKVDVTIHPHDKQFAAYEKVVKQKRENLVQQWMYQDQRNKEQPFSKKWYELGNAITSLQNIAQARDWLINKAAQEAAHPNGNGYVDYAKLAENGKGYTGFAQLEADEQKYRSPQQLNEIQRLADQQQGPTPIVIKHPDPQTPAQPIVSTSKAPIAPAAGAAAAPTISPAPGAAAATPVATPQPAASAVLPAQPAPAPATPAPAASSTVVPTPVVPAPSPQPIAPPAPAPVVDAKAVSGSITPPAIQGMAYTDKPDLMKIDSAKSPGGQREDLDAGFKKSMLAVKETLVAAHDAQDKDHPLAGNTLDDKFANLPAKTKEEFAVYEKVQEARGANLKEQSYLRADIAAETGDPTRKAYLEGTLKVLEDIQAKRDALWKVAAEKKAKGEEGYKELEGSFKVLDNNQAPRMLNENKDKVKGYTKETLDEKTRSELEGLAGEGARVHYSTAGGHPYTAVVFDNEQKMADFLNVMRDPKKHGILQGEHILTKHQGGEITVFISNKDMTTLDNSVTGRSGVEGKTYATPESGKAKEVEKLEGLGPVVSTSVTTTVAPKLPGAAMAHAAPSIAPSPAAGPAVPPAPLKLGQQPQQPAPDQPVPAAPAIQPAQPAPVAPEQSVAVAPSLTSPQPLAPSPQSVQPPVPPVGPFPSAHMPGDNKGHAEAAEFAKSLKQSPVPVAPAQSSQPLAFPPAPPQSPASPKAEPQVSALAQSQEASNQTPKQPLWKRIGKVVVGVLSIAAVGAVAAACILAAPIAIPAIMIAGAVTGAVAGGVAGAKDNIESMMGAATLGAVVGAIAGGPLLAVAGVAAGVKLIADGVRGKETRTEDLDVTKGARDKMLGRDQGKGRSQERAKSVEVSSVYYAGPPVYSNPNTQSTAAGIIRQASVVSHAPGTLSPSSAAKGTAAAPSQGARGPAQLG